MNSEKRKFTGGKFVKSLIVIVGIIIGQAVFYGPSLIGQKILLPLDILAQPGVYIPPTPGKATIQPHDMMLSELIYQFEPDRRFAGSQLHQGRFPLWVPYPYGGVPLVWSKYSLLLLLGCPTKSRVILAWERLFAALVADIGMFFFCRKSLRVGFWPATVCAWCYPLTAFFVFWQGYPTGLAVCWNGKPVPVLRTNYAIRGVVLPAGSGTLEFVYKPRSLIIDQRLLRIVNAIT